MLAQEFVGGEGLPGHVAHADLTVSTLELSFRHLASSLVGARPSSQRPVSPVRAGANGRSTPYGEGRITTWCSIEAPIPASGISSRTIGGSRPRGDRRADPDRGDDHQHADDLLTCSVHGGDIPSLDRRYPGRRHQAERPVRGGCYSGGCADDGLRDHEVLEGHPDAFEHRDVLGGATHLGARATSARSATTCPAPIAPSSIGISRSPASASATSLDSTTICPRRIVSVSSSRSVR